MNNIYPDRYNNKEKDKIYVEKNKIEKKNGHRQGVLDLVVIIHKFM